MFPTIRVCRKSRLKGTRSSWERGIPARRQADRERACGLQLSIETEEKRIKGLQGRLERGVVDTDGEITDRIEASKRIAKGTIKEQNLLHNNVTKYMSIADNRRIAHVLFADPIGVSSDHGPAGTGPPSR